MSQESVFHGSPELFDDAVANPRRNIRTVGEEVIFNEESFYATPHKWIALAYTYQPKQINGGGVYKMAVDLYSDNKEVVIFGVGSLDESLEVLYGDGGYLYHFDSDNFIYKEGLGSQEVIATEPTAPIAVEKIDDPIEAMRELGVTFKFTVLRSCF